MTWTNFIIYDFFFHFIHSSMMDLFLSEYLNNDIET